MLHVIQHRVSAISYILPLKWNRTQIILKAQRLLTILSEMELFLPHNPLSIIPLNKAKYSTDMAFISYPFLYTWVFIFSPLDELSGEIVFHMDYSTNGFCLYLTERERAPNETNCYVDSYRSLLSYSTPKERQKISVQPSRSLPQKEIVSYCGSCSNFPNTLIASLPLILSSR